MVVRSIASFLVRVVFAIVHITIIVPFGLIISLPPMMYWLALVAINSKHYDVDKVAPFLSQKDEENGDLGKFRRPKILFDGCAWAFGFELGVCQHLLKNYDIQGANCEVYAISAGNLPALCLLLEKDPEEEVKVLYPLLLQGMHQSPYSQPLYGYCGDLCPVHLCPLPRFAYIRSYASHSSLCIYSRARRRGGWRTVGDR
mmetsp:Transcript_53965/g.112719  ORF Transcript_53965/g.112719 Transcript_53965/m.112719 type:complete len:200 (-) Transcript_53965:876-1475(-)